MHFTSKSAFFQDFTQGRTVVSYRRFGTTYPSHFQASKQPVYVVMQINLLKMAADCGLWTEFFSSLLQWIYTLKRTGGRLLRKLLAPLYRTTRRHVPDNCNPKNHAYFHCIHSPSPHPILLSRAFFSVFIYRLSPQAHTGPANVTGLCRVHCSHFTNNLVLIGCTCVPLL